MKVCVTGVHILRWQKSSNSYASVDRSLLQWGKHYLTTHHTQNMENSGNHNIPQLVHTNKIVPMIYASLEWGTCVMRAPNRNTNQMKCTDTVDLRLFFVMHLIVAEVL
jgi:hypothetical protein